MSKCFELDWEEDAFKSLVLDKKIKGITLNDDQDLIVALEDDTIIFAEGDHDYEVQVKAFEPSYYFKGSFDKVTYEEVLNDAWGIILGDISFSDLISLNVVSQETLNQFLQFQADIKVKQEAERIAKREADRAKATAVKEAYKNSLKKFFDSLSDDQKSIWKNDLNWQVVE